MVECPLPTHGGHQTKKGEALQRHPRPYQSLRFKYVDISLPPKKAMVARPWYFSPKTAGLTKPFLLSPVIAISFHFISPRDNTSDVTIKLTRDNGGYKACLFLLRDGAGYIKDANKNGSFFWSGSGGGGREPLLSNGSEFQTLQDCSFLPYNFLSCVPSLSSLSASTPLMQDCLVSMPNTWHCEHTRNPTQQHDVGSHRHALDRSRGSM